LTDWLLNEKLAVSNSLAHKGEHSIEVQKVKSFVVSAALMNTALLLRLVATSNCRAQSQNRLIM
jgi:hypothetical protein